MRVFVRMKQENGQEIETSTGLYRLLNKYDHNTSIIAANYSNDLEYNNVSIVA